MMTTNSPAPTPASIPKHLSGPDESEYGTW